MKNNYIHVYTGNGKGKTTASIGVGIRALGADKKVCMIQFMKGRKTGELKILENLENFEVFRFGSKDFVDKKNLGEDDFRFAKEGLDKAKNIIKTERYDLVILDEINVAVDYKLIDENEIVKLINDKPKNLEIVLTGRYASKEFIKIADIVTDMKEIKHPYSNDKITRKGFEF